MPNRNIRFTHNLRQFKPAKLNLEKLLPALKVLQKKYETKLEKAKNSVQSFDSQLPHFQHVQTELTDLFFGLRGEVSQELEDFGKRRTDALEKEIKSLEEVLTKIGSLVWEIEQMLRGAINRDVAKRILDEGSALRAIRLPDNEKLDPLMLKNLRISVNLQTKKVTIQEEKS